MAYVQDSPGMTGSINEHASALAAEWRRLTRAATFVALLTAPAFFLILFDTNHLGLVPSLVITAVGVVMFRGLVEVITRKLIPSPSLYGADPSLKQEDIVLPAALLVLARQVPPAAVLRGRSPCAARHLPGAVRCWITR
jgi:hypothetical protein